MINVSYDIFTDAFLSKITEYNFIHLDEADKTHIVDGYMKRAWAQFVSTCRFKDKFSIVSIDENPDDNDGDDSEEDGVVDVGGEEDEILDEIEAEDTIEEDSENDADDDEGKTDNDGSDDIAQRTEEFILDIDEYELDEIVDIISEGMLVQWMKQYMYKQENLENLLNTVDFSAYSPAELLYRVTNAYNMCKKDFINMMREYSFNHGDLLDLHL